MEAGDHRGLSRAYIAREAAAFYGSHYEQAIRSCEEAIVHYGEVGYTPAAASMALASALLFGPTPVGEAIARCEELKADGDRTMRAAIDASLAAIYALRGDFQRADASLVRAVEGWDAIGLQISLRTTALERQLFIARMRGDLSSAEALARERLGVYTETNETAWVATTAVQLAWVLVERDELDEADGLLEQATSTAHPHDVLVRSLIGSVPGAVTCSSRRSRDRPRLCAPGCRCTRGNRRRDRPRHRVGGEGGGRVSRRARRRRQRCRRGAAEQFCADKESTYAVEPALAHARTLTAEGEPRSPGALIGVAATDRHHRRRSAWCTSFRDAHGRRGRQPRPNGAPTTR